MCMKNVETLDSIMGHHCAAASIMTKKRKLKVDLGECLQMYKAPFLFLPEALNSLNPPLLFLLWRVTAEAEKRRWSWGWSYATMDSCIMVR